MAYPANYPIEVSNKFSFIYRINCQVSCGIHKKCPPTQKACQTWDKFGIGQKGVQSKNFPKSKHVLIVVSLY